MKLKLVKNGVAPVAVMAVMKEKMAWRCLFTVVAMVVALAGCSTGNEDTNNNGTPPGTDPVGLKSVTINDVAVDIGFKGTAGWAGTEGWGFNSNGAQNGGIYSAASAADLASVTVVATPLASGATVGYAFVHYTGEHPGTGAGTDPEYLSPAEDAYTTSGALGTLNDQDYIAVKVSNGEKVAHYKFRVAVNAPLLGEGGVSAGGAKLGWTIPDLDWTHNQGAYYHNNVGPIPDQSIGLVLQDTLSLSGKTLSADAPSGAMVTWAICTTGNNNTGVTTPQSGAWKPLSESLPGTIASGSLLSVRAANDTKTLYYNWWVFSKADVKLSALSVAGNVVDTAKLIAFSDTWSGATLQEIVVPVDGDKLESAKIAWTEPLGMGLAIAVTDEKEPAGDDWLGTSRGQNDSYAIVVQPPAVDLTNGQVLSIRARISEQVWYYRAKIVFRDLRATDADLTGLTIGTGPTAVRVTALGTSGATVQTATAGSALNLTLAQATGAAIVPAGGPLAEFLYIKATNITSTPGATAGWSSSGTLSFDNGEYLIIQSFAGELASQYYVFPVTVTYPNADDVKLNTLTIGGGTVAATNFGTPWIRGGTDGTAGSVEISYGQNGAGVTNATAAVVGTVPPAAAGSTIKYLKTTTGITPEETDWTAASTSAFSFAATGDILWVRVAAGNQTVKTYKIAVTARTGWIESDAVLTSLAINGDFNFANFSFGYTVNVTDFGTPNATAASAVSGTFSVQAGKTTGFGPGLYVNATVPGGVSVALAKAAAAPTEASGWTSSLAGQAPPTLEFANNDTLWVRVTAGTSYVKYYKFTVTVTAAP